MDRWENADRLAQELIKEMVALDDMREHIESLPTDHPHALAYRQRLTVHMERAVEFAHRVQKAMRAANN